MTSSSSPKYTSLRQEIMEPVDDKQSPLSGMTAAHGWAEGGAISDTPDIIDHQHHDLQQQHREQQSQIRVQKPRDPFNSVYLSLVLAGTGFLLPYNSFVTAVDYFHSHFPGTTIVFDMSLVYLLVGFAAVMLNNALVVKISVQRRILMGQVMALLALMAAAFLVIGLDSSLPQDLAHAVILLAVAVTSFGCTIQQSSFYGYAGMLPKRFTQAVMAGESTAGVLTSLNRIITKLLIPNEKVNTLIFFAISGVALLSCLIMHQLARRTHLVRHYTAACQKAGMGDDEWSLQLSTEVSRNSVVEENDSTPGDETRPQEVNDAEINDAEFTEVTLSSRGRQPFTLSACWRSIVGGYRKRMRLSHNIWPYMVSIATAYYITLCLFPGIESEVVNCSWHEWMPIILMAVFNVTDLTGKLIAAIPYDWPTKRLILATCTRVLLVPLLLICVAPRSHPALAHPFWPILLSAILGISNGYFGSVPMILAPSKVPEDKKELAGNVMTVSYNIGLTLGAITAYLLKFIIGPSNEDTICSMAVLNATSLIPPAR